LFSKVLIANRGAIACRIIRTLNRIGVGSVAVCSDADRHSLHVTRADEYVLLGGSSAKDSYLDMGKILDAARRTGAGAIHPGYGFLSENADFAQSCETAGIVFIGPTAYQMRAFGLKHTAREIAAREGVPLLPGSGLLRNREEAMEAADRIGYPVMLKSTAGGGGIGMKLCFTPAELEDAFTSVERTSRASFKHGGMYVEKFVASARHIEVQIFGDGMGSVIALGERDCSAQRRNQKVIEETPAPNLPDAVRRELLECAVRLGKTVSYRSAGTVEFVYDADHHHFYFLEVNTRLQVEHGVTEEVTGIDLVEWMIRMAADDMPPLDQIRPQFQGHAIQARIYAEDPGKDFQPSAGILTDVQFPAETRVETWVERGTDVTSFYDPLLAKVIVYGETRDRALAKMRIALEASRLSGIETNLEFLRQATDAPEFRQGAITTRYLGRLQYQARTFEVLEGGTMTTVQDWPGRLGYWAVGVPPSGPMDSLSFRMGNRLLGNAEGAAGLECTMSGPWLRFNCDTRIALTGADFGARLDGVPAVRNQVLQVATGSVLEMGEVQGPGARAYILFDGGLDVALYLASASTFTLGKFGGHAGRALRSGDVLHVRPAAPSSSAVGPAEFPHLTNDWRIGVINGPHAAPDFFTERDIRMLSQTSWKVHYNSSRTGVRLIGPKPEWARRDGGEAGLHPSNIHDNAYAIGAVDFTGDMPVILGPDGPSLGGFVCPMVIADAELWKIGQLRAGDSVHFQALNDEDAVVRKMASNVVCRASGDRYLLIEYGEPILDLNLRFRVHELLAWFEREKPKGIIDITPGIRSLQIHYDSARITRIKLLDLIERAEEAMPDSDDMAIPSRVIRLPLSWDDPATRLAIEKYMTTVRPDAPWCPSNIEFIRRVNGLDSIEDVRRIVFDASYLVLGLGDVYLGAPVATPLDPRHRLVTTKYNPARTWTAENSVGIGGAYLCVYGMEGPGGYQFVGRTIQMWNRWRTTREFSSPWLLRFFDQIRFYPVEAGELLEMRDKFPHGKVELDIREEPFRPRDYRTFLAQTGEQAAEFKSRQQTAFEAERERWRVAGLDRSQDAFDEPAIVETRTVPAGCRELKSPTHASVWTIGVKPGDQVTAGQKLVIVESMKMEIAVAAPHDGVIVDVLCSQGSQVAAGQSLLFFRPEAF
jgi:urea carboxylase